MAVSRLAPVMRVAQLAWTRPPGLLVFHPIGIVDQFSGEMVILASQCIPVRLISGVQKALLARVSAYLAR